VVIVRDMIEGGGKKKEVGGYSRIERLIAQLLNAWHSFKSLPVDDL